MRSFIATLVLFLLLAPGFPAAPPEKIVGLYVHQHWPYRHPYAARTWTLEDWTSFARDLRKLGYNTVMVWPMLETMPNPLTPSDEASLKKHAAVIDVLHKKFGMRVIVVLCANVAAIDAEAAKATFEKRHFFFVDRRVNPADRADIERMMAFRAKVMAPLKAANGVAVIDSDPAGYPGSGNKDFVELFVKYRKMLDGLRPGMDLYYWMHVGWAGYSRFYQSGTFSPGTEAEHVDTLKMIAAAKPEPWKLATGQLAAAAKAGVADRVVSLNYGRIEAEPSFPSGNFGGDRAYEGGNTPGPLGVLGNAQTHCVQLPNIFAFARGAAGKPVADPDYEEFAARLVPGQSKLILRAWKAMAGTDAAEMRTVAAAVQASPEATWKEGELRGLLFGSAPRFRRDLLLQLRFKSAALDFIEASKSGRNVKRTLGAFVEVAQAWQRQHGYENRWNWPELREATAKLHSREVDEAWDPPITETGFAKVQKHYRLTESMTLQLLSAFHKAWAALPE